MKGELPIMNATEADVRDLKSRMKLVEGEITKLTLNMSNHISWERLVRPQTAVKVNVNKYGLVVGSESLKPSDLPIIPMEQVDGLLKVLAEKENISKENEAQNNIGSGGTACKITFNKYGEVLSGVELEPSDIPSLPSSNIIGLDDRIDGIKKSIDELKMVQGTTSDVTPGTYPKITYNSSGRVTGGSTLTIDDIPNEIITSINVLKSSLLDYVHTKQFTMKLADIERNLSTEIKLRSENQNDKINELSSICNDLKGKMIQLSTSLENVVTQNDFIREMNEIHQATATITTLKTNVDILVSNYMSIKNENTRMSEMVSTLTKKVEALEEKVNKP